MQVFEFGWLPEIATYVGADFTVEPIERDHQVFDRIANAAKDGWFYPPLKPQSGSASLNEPLRYVDWFALPLTHRLYLPEEEPDGEKLAAFIIELWGILKGMQLLPAPWGHFYRTPAKLQVLVSRHA